MAACVLVNGGSIPFREAEGSPKISMNRDSRKNTRTGYIRWSNIDAAILELFPAPPAMFGRHPTDTVLYAESMEIEPISDELSSWMSTPSGVAIYTAPADHATHPEEAKCTITYSSVPSPTGTIISVKMSIGGEYQMISPINMKWQDLVASDPDNAWVTSEDAKIGKYIPTAEWAFTRQRATVVPWATLRACMGKVNAGHLNSYPFYNVARETMLMTGAEIGFTYAANGDQQWTLDYRFNERIITSDGTVYDPPGGWNHNYREVDNVWARIVPAGATTKTIQYPTTGLFLTLF